MGHLRCKQGHGLLTLQEIPSRNSLHCAIYPKQLQFTAEVDTAHLPYTISYRREETLPQLMQYFCTLELIYAFQMPLPWQHVYTSAESANKEEIEKAQMNILM